jgi:spermidine/putrescine transport system ATP-binding protein
VNWIGEIGVRPEATRITREQPASGVRSVCGVVESSTFLGNCFHVQAKLLSGETVIAEVVRLEHTFKPGDRVHMWWQPCDELQTVAEA